MPTVVARDGNNYGKEFQRERSRILAGGARCSYCGDVASVADHHPPITRHEHVAIGICCRLVPSCRDCSDAQGGRLRHGRTIVGPDGADEQLILEPVGYEPEHPCWQVSWLDNLRQVPPNAVWPRLMTPPHPRACDSLGPRFIAWSEARRGRPLRWWQCLVSTRLLEVDIYGLLVWDTLILALARQLGKSWWLSDVLFWRIHQAELFGEEQLAIHTGKDVAVCREVQRSARIMAKRDPSLYKVREVNGQEEIEYKPDGSRYQIKAKDATYGFSASIAAVDEAWKVPASSIEEGLVPTMAERIQAQLLLVSTAHRRATSLMLNRRQRAIDAMEDPGSGDLLIEWSAPRWLELEDVNGWRMASPHWTEQREKLVRQRLDAAVAGEVEDIDEPDPLESFRSQWLNQWPLRRDKPGKGERLIPEGVWPELAADIDPVGRIWIAVEDWFGQGAAAAAAGHAPDGRIIVGGHRFERRADAFAWAANVRAVYPNARLIIGSSLKGDAGVKEVRARGEVIDANGTLTRAALATFRQLVADGGIVHDGTGDLAEQIEGCRVVPQSTGLAINGGRADLLKATVWAVAECAKPTRSPRIA